MTAIEKLNRRIEKHLHICVGLDSDINKIPPHLHSEPSPVLAFNKIIIENTFEFAAAYKINLAFYEKDGINGLETLAQTIEMIPPDILIIGDAKRGDISNTSQMYAEALYDNLHFDSATLNPYMGYDSIEPFLNYHDKLNFILALTSNKSAIDFEKLKLPDGSSLFQTVIKKVKEWNIHHNCGIVFGATNREELNQNINSFETLPVLLPGIGTQGGSLEDVVLAFKRKKINSYLVNISRGLIYSDATRDFGSTVNNKMKGYTIEIQNLINL